MNNFISCTDDLLTIKPGVCINVGERRVEIESELKRSFDCIHFRVLAYQSNENDIVKSAKSMILRIGEAEGSLLNELKVREILKKHPLVESDCYYQLLDNVIIETLPEETLSASHKMIQMSELNVDQDYLDENVIQVETFYAKAIAIMSEVIAESKTLAVLARDGLNLQQALLISIQLCQFVRNLATQGWCMYDISLESVTFDRILIFHELNFFAPLDSSLSIILDGQFCPPELLYSSISLNEASSTYIVGKVILYLICGETYSPVIPRISLLNQVLQLATSLEARNRPNLDQLLKLIFDIRIQQKRPLHWQFSGITEIGLSPNRLHNEDSYCIVSRTINQEHILLAAVADGMGGMSGGEIASQIAINTIVEAFFTLFNRDDIEAWLVKTIEHANYVITDTLENGGTTISIALVLDDKLYFGHVGDSRIQVIRNGISCQISQDHSKVAMLVANGDITPESCLEHPERNILIRSLGAVRQLPANYIQTSGNSTGDYPLCIHPGDSVVLCSDGAWDYLDRTENSLLIDQNFSVDERVKLAMQYILSTEAHDNATLIILECED